MKLDNIVDKPSHYSDVGFPVECIEYTSLLPPYMSNAFKYVFRSKHKGKESEDIQKAIKYIRMYKEAVENSDYFMSYSFLTKTHKSTLLAYLSGTEYFDVFGVGQLAVLRNIFNLFGCANPTYDTDVESGLDSILDSLESILKSARLRETNYNPIP